MKRKREREEERAKGRKEKKGREKRKVRKREREGAKDKRQAKQEEEVLSGMNANARKMALRDSSSSRLQLAFVFWNEDVMVKMLNILGDYPPTDMAIARLHNRLCFAGLAAFALGKKKGSESFVKLGQDVSCLECAYVDLIFANKIFAHLLSIPILPCHDYTNSV